MNTKEHFVVLRENEINPKILKIGVGDVVNWVNYSEAIHTIIFETGDYESGDLRKGESFRLVFDSSGEYNYYNQGDESMIGKIIVE